MDRFASGGFVHVDIYKDTDSPLEADCRCHKIYVYRVVKQSLLKLILLMPDYKLNQPL